MIIGVPKEIKDHEYRVGVTPSLVSLLVEDGHEVLVQTKAGEKIGFCDESFAAKGAKIVQTAEVHLIFPGVSDSLLTTRL